MSQAIYEIDSITNEKYKEYIELRLCNNSTVYQITKTIILPFLNSHLLHPISETVQRNLKSCNKIFEYYRDNKPFQEYAQLPSQRQDSDNAP